MSSRVFHNSGPKRSHLLRGRGVGGEVLDLRKDVDDAIDRLEAESILDVQWSFDGAVPPLPGQHVGQYGFCHTGAAGYPAGSVWYDDGVEVADVSKQGLVLSPRADVVGAIPLVGGTVYMALSPTPPYSWTSRGGGGGGAHAATHLPGASDPIDAATTLVGGLMSAADKTKLDGLNPAPLVLTTAARLLLNPPNGTLVYDTDLMRLFVWQLDIDWPIWAEV